MPSQLLPTLSSLSNHVGVVYIDKNKNANAVYYVEGQAKILCDSELMSDRKIRSAVKKEVRSRLNPTPKLVIARLTRTYFNKFQDMWVPYFLGAALLPFAILFAKASRVAMEATLQFSWEILTALTLVQAGSIMARGIGKERTRNPSEIMVLAKGLFFLCKIGVLIAVLWIGGNHFTDQFISAYEFLKSRGLSFLAPNAWFWMSIIFLVLGCAWALVWPHFKHKMLDYVNPKIRNTKLNVNNR